MHRIANIVLTGAFLLMTFSVMAQRGKSGALTVTAANTIVNEYTNLTADAAAGATTITVANSALNTNGRFPGNLAAGDLIMIIQLQGATIDGQPYTWNTNWGMNAIGNRDSSWGAITNYNNCGNWELAEVYSVPNGTSITLDCPITKSYTAAGRVVIVRMPRYTTLTINAGGSITCTPWNGTIGGVCAIEVETNTTINGSINTSGNGFRGGALANSAGQFGMGEWASILTNDGADKGEGIAGWQADYLPFGGRYCAASAANGGGGGNDLNCGGGGGANAGNPNLWNGHGNPDLSGGAPWISAWNLHYTNFSAITSSGGGQGGYSFSDQNRNATITAPGNALWGGDNRRRYGGFGGRPLDYSTGRLFLGGGGGSGDEDNSHGSGGASGGGLIYLMNYGTVTGSGTIQSNGNTAANTGGAAAAGSIAGDDGAGGGGAGGTLIINSVGNISGVTLSANGGKGGDQVIVYGAFVTSTDKAYGPGGGGGGGYIGISNGAPTMTMNGGANGVTTSPALSEFVPNGATRGGAGSSGTVTNFVINAPNVTICAGQAATLTATLNGTVPGGTTIIWYDALVAGNVIGNGATYTTPVLVAGTYTYYVATCPGTYHQPVIVTATNTPLVSAGNDVTICTGGNATLSASGGTAYVWSPATNLTNPNISNPVANPASTTTYVVTVTTSCGNGNDTVVVNVTSGINASITGNTTICAGGNTTLTASGGSSYSWSNGSTATSIIVAPTTNTTYTVYASLGSCSGSATSTVTVSSGITASITGSSTTVCPGSPVTLSASGGNTYSWSTSATTSSIVVNPTSNSTYSVTAFSGSCSNTTSVSVTVVNNITATVFGSTTICTGGSATLAATGGSNYSWSTGGTTSSIVVTPTTNTTYSVIVSSGTCADTGTATVTVSSGITASITGNTAVCSGNAATLVASGGSSYSWSNGSSAATIIVNPTSATSYTVTAVSGNCSSSTSVTVNVSPPMNVSMSSVAIQCGTNLGSASASVSGGTPAYTYSWFPGGQTTATATGLAAGGAYSVTITDAAGCSRIDTINVVALNAPFTVVTGNTLLCTGDATTLSAVGGNSFSWSTGATSSSITLTPSTSASYTVVSYVGNCSDTAIVNVQVSPPPVANSSGNITVCTGTSATLTASGGGTYSWSTGATSTSITVAPTSSTAYTFTATIGSCTDTASASVTVLPIPTPTTAATNTLICGGDAVTLAATGGTTYSWSTGSTAASIVVSPPASTTYSVTAGNGYCSATSTVSISVMPPPVASITGSQNICAGNAASLTATGGGTYAWSDGSTTAMINPVNAGTYSVVVTIGSCTDTAVANVVVNPLPTATALSDVTIINGQSTQLTATGGLSYAWDNGMNGSAITVSPGATTVYCVTAFDANGCQDTACVTVTVELCQGALYLPNAFSPNGDGDNDSLQIYYPLRLCLESLKLNIYNRWGEKVYETDDVDFRWDGFYNSSALKNTVVGGHEVYSYYMTVRLVDGQVFERKGNITLLR